MVVHRPDEVKLFKVNIDSLQFIEMEIILINIKPMKYIGQFVSSSYGNLPNINLKVSKTPKPTANI